MSTPGAQGRGAISSVGIVWFIVIVCSATPLIWVILQLISNPTTLAELRIDPFRAALLARTCLYNGSVAIVAAALAIVPAIVLGRGRGWIASALWFVLPIGLLLPSLVISYGWAQLIRLLGIALEPAGFFDVARCIWSLATWLWPVPAILMGLALRRGDVQTQQQAALDGVLWRVAMREMFAPAIAATSIVSVLAMQEFAVYEPTGISVVATEVRMVFETGAFSSPSNPITQPMGIAGAPRALVLPNQRARAAAAIATALPLIGVVAILSVVAAVGARKLSTAEHVETGSWPRALDAPRWIVLVAWSVVVIALVVPLIALMLSLKRTFIPSRVWAEFGPQASGSMLVAGVTGAVALVLAASASVIRIGGAMTIALLSFLIGGQFVAIALIRVYNRAGLSWMYVGVPVIVIAYIARFGWIALAAARATFSSSAWRALRDMAALDGATPARAAFHVVWPLAWPLLVASAAFVAALSLTEVPATVLISPQHPQVLIPMLMTWVHMLRYDAMIEASLLMCALVVFLGAAALLLLRTGRRAVRLTPLVLLAVVLMLTGCDPVKSPDAIWLETGNGPGQTVYPRGITYSPADDSFFVVDRQARIQHLDHRGNFIAEWQTPQWLQGKPVGISIGPDGNVYVPDTHYHRVLVYKPDGNGPIRQWGSKGEGPGQFIYPTDIAFDSAGRIFVSEYGDHDRIQVFDANGKYIFEFGKFGDGPGEFSRPQSMLIDGDVLYVTDACNHRIEIFKTDGTFVRAIGKVGSGPGEFRFPYGLAMDSKKNLIVCEFGNNRVQRIDPKSGACLGIWGMAGREPGELAYPWGVAVDKDDRIIAVDAGNNRLQVFEF